MNEQRDWPEVREYRSSAERRPTTERHGVGDAYPMWEVEPQEACYWLDCGTLALPITYVDGIWLRLCDVHAKAVHHALDEGLAIERRWQGDVHPVVWVARREGDSANLSDRP
jgi:hypothetical protein